MITVLKANIIEALEWLSDYEYQKNSWFALEGGITYDENVEEIFLFTGIQEAFEAGETVFDKKTDQALRDLEIACDELGYQWDGKEKELLDSDGMAIIREMARKCLELVRESDGSQSTVKFS